MMKWNLMLCVFLSFSLLNGNEKRLNNLVFELASLEQPKFASVLEIPFEMKRDGWIWLQLKDISFAKNPDFSLRFDNASKTFGCEQVDGCLETKRYLAGGKHVLTMSCPGGFRAGRIRIHRIPEIILADIRSNEPETAHNVYDFRHSWEFLDKVILPNATTLIFDSLGFNPDIPPSLHDREQKEWIARGGRTLVWVPIFRTRDRRALVRAWSAELSDPLCGGIIHDEVNVKDAPSFPEWAAGLDLLNTNRNFRGILPDGTLEHKNVYYYFEHTNNYYGREPLAVLRPSGGLSGSVYVMLSGNGRKDSGFFQKNIFLDKGKMYTLSAAFQTKDFQGENKILEIPGTEAALAPEKGTADWKRFHISFRAPGTGSYALDVLNPARGMVGVDDIQLMEGDKQEAYVNTPAGNNGTLSKNLVLNGNFSQGVSGWESWTTDSKKWDDLMRAVQRSGSMLLYEDYLSDDPPEMLDKNIKFLAGLFAARKKEVPGIEHNLSYIFGLAHRNPWSRDLSPQYDYKGSLDRQFRRCAVNPVYKDMGGVGYWILTKADDELLRYSSALLRHYAILGKTEPFFKDSYFLSYLKNPDFEEGTSGWEIFPAFEGSVVTGRNFQEIPFGLIVSGAVHGSKQLKTVAATGKDNVIRQKITGLTPGKCYSLTFYTMSDTLDAKTHLGDAKIEGVEIVHGKGYEKIFTRTALQEKKKSISFELHFQVFRARSPEAMLTFSDQRFDSGVPRLPEKTVILWDGVQVQPYYGDCK